MITSLQNPKIKRARLLLSQSKARHKQRVFVLEGIRLLEESLQSPIAPEIVFHTSNLGPRGKGLIREFSNRNVVCEIVDEDVFSVVSATETPQGLLALFPFIDNPLPNNLDFLMIADEIRDPGNFGTLMRTSLAAGADGLVYTPGTVDPYSPKVVRAGMGAHFHLPLLKASWDEMPHLIQDLRLFLTDMDQGDILWEADLTVPLAMLIGGEAHGPGKAAREQADQVIHIPMAKKTESLNVSAAGAIFLYEVRRQRTNRNRKSESKR
jgi:TrmH family RNA methyltransferase